MSTTLAQIRKAAPAGVEVWNDEDCICYRADAPAGFHFSADGLHGYIAVYCYRSEMADARADLLDRVTGAELEPCSDDNENCLCASS